MPDASLIKSRVRDFWNTQPCGTRGNPYPEGSVEYFRWIESQRDEREPFIGRFARWGERAGQHVLEMGVGAGTDFVRFVRAGAHAHGVDMSSHSARLVRQRLRNEQLTALVSVADVEQLPFSDGTFDVVYSWGVIHHTADTTAAARELLRVLKPGGEFCAMVYHRYSLVMLQAYILYGLLQGRPMRSLDEIAREHLESFGTKVYTVADARALFAPVDVHITHVLTPYDLRYSRFRYLPAYFGRLLPSFFGYFMVIEGRKS